MTDTSESSSPVGARPAGPVPVAPSPVGTVEPWQNRFDSLAAVLIVVAAVTLVSAVVSAYAQATTVTGFDQVTAVFDSSQVDLIVVIQRAGQAVGLLSAGALLVAFLLVSLGPAATLTAKRLNLLRAVIVVGFATAGLTGFAAVATAIGYESDGPGQAATSNHALNRIGIASPLAMAALLALYVAWCAVLLLPTREVVPPEA